MASVSRHYEKDTIVYVLQLTLAEGMTVDIDRVPWFRLIEVIGEDRGRSRAGHGPCREFAWTVEARARHLERRWPWLIHRRFRCEQHRARPCGVQCDGQGSVVEPERDGPVVRLTEQEGSDFAGLTEHQMHAFDAWRLGYYERPRNARWPTWPPKSGSQEPRLAATWEPSRTPHIGVLRHGLACV